jgi:hypothetical protein
MQTLPDKVLAHLKAGNTLTTAGVIGLFGHIQLAHAVFKLRQRGYPVKAQRFKAMNGKSYAEYRLEEKASSTTNIQVGSVVRVKRCVSTEWYRAGDEGEVVSVKPYECVDVRFRSGLGARSYGQWVVKNEELEVI